MITREQLPAVLDHPVLDEGGKKIGDAKHIFLDDATGRPEWVSVKTGLFGTSESFVPLRDADLVGDHMEVPYTKGKVKDAPHVDIDSGGHLSQDEEHQLYDYYGIDWDEAWSRANRPGEGGWAHGAGGAAAGGAAAGGAAGAAGAAGRTAPKPGPGPTARDTAATGRPQAAAGGRSEAATGRRTPATGAQGRTREGDDAMTLSEERMHVGVERREVGRARLRKYVVTEEVEKTVPVRHEEVRVEREPITDANRDAALSGPEISEAEHEVVLHEERPVVETEAVPVERVRLTTEEHTEQETVRGRVRKERIKGEAEPVADETGETGDIDDTGRGRRRP
ncbi:DUF2382 domain-containing protein [Streptomyces naganishii]|uniref:Photosystem reaction center subunit H n=1 Tax=Streptomyces naganishii JCM 4654 TaxID=1306179 RepID=A0A918YB42_9ACTN|nr:PRC and DUF2382 domain-containing protein [Streptomyces naganishii]GHD95763.1 photosystem reaction center subunit H [Streptomyces naganishii JCM 4654]